MKLWLKRHVYLFLLSYSVAFGATPDFNSVLSLDQEFPPVEMCGEIYVDYERHMGALFGLEQAIKNPPVGSFANTDPKEYEQILNLYQRVPSLHRFLAPLYSEKNVPMEKLFDAILNGNHRVISRLSSIIERFPEKAKPFGQVVAKFLDRWKLQTREEDCSPEGFEYCGMFIDRRRDEAGRIFSPRNREAVSVFLGIGHKYIWVPWSELRAAMLVPDLRAIEYSPKDDFDRLRRSSDMKLDYSEQRQTIALVWGNPETGRWNWGEVAPGVSMLFPRKPSMEKVLRKLHSDINLAQKLHPMPKIHLFANGGIHRDAKAEIEALGVRVHGTTSDK